MCGFGATFSFQVAGGYAETERFCRYLDGQPDLPAAARTVLARDLPRMAALLEMSRTEDADARYAASGTVQAS